MSRWFGEILIFIVDKVDLMTRLKLNFKIKINFFFRCRSWIKFIVDKFRCFYNIFLIVYRCSVVTFIRFFCWLIKKINRKYFGINFNVYSFLITKVFHSPSIFKKRRKNKFLLLKEAKNKCWCWNWSKNTASNDAKKHSTLLTDNNFYIIYH